jgi:hypothetical protein
MLPDFSATMASLTPALRLAAALRGQASLLNSRCLPIIPSPPTQQAPLLRLLHRRTGLDRGELGRRRHARRRGLPGSLAVLSGTSRNLRRLVRLSCRIVFALLRADLSPPDALHEPSRVRSFVGYAAGSSAGSGLEPLGQRAFTGARSLGSPLPLYLFDCSSRSDRM